jgi:hypothetical protein
VGTWVWWCVLGSPHSPRQFDALKVRQSRAQNIMSDHLSFCAVCSRAFASIVPGAWRTNPVCEHGETLRQQVVKDIASRIYDTPSVREMPLVRRWHYRWRLLNDWRRKRGS